MFKRPSVVQFAPTPGAERSAAPDRTRCYSTTREKIRRMRSSDVQPTPNQIHQSRLKALTRRQLFRRCTTGMGAIALTSLMNENLFAAEAGAPTRRHDPLGLRPPHFTPRAKNIIYLHMAGAPSQLDL